VWWLANLLCVREISKNGIVTRGFQILSALLLFGKAEIKLIQATRFGIVKATKYVDVMLVVLLDI
jgi:hypothetical protein